MAEKNDWISVVIKKLGNTLEITNFMKYGGLELRIDQDGNVRFGDLCNNVEIIKKVINGHAEIDMNAVINSGKEKEMTIENKRGEGNEEGK